MKDEHTVDKEDLEPEETIQEEKTVVAEEPVKDEEAVNKKLRNQKKRILRRSKVVLDINIKRCYNTVASERSFLDA